MNTLFSLLDAQAPAQQGGGLSMWIMLILIFVIMWLFMIRPQRKQQKELDQFRAGLKKGDKIVTIGGIYGVVDSISDKYVSVRVDGDVKLRFDKTAIQKDPNSDAQ